MAATEATAEQSVQSAQPLAGHPSWWKWAIALTVSLGALMEVIDTSIVNVALNDMQGNLGATLSEIGWVITGYSMANVIVIPLSAWLGDAFGKKNYFIFSMIGFTLASILCGMSVSLPMLIFARILQGLMGGGLLAKAQAILYETFSKEEQGLAQAIFGLGVIVGPAIGPTLGGFLTDNYGWRWIFFINVPVGILAVLASIVFLIQDRKPGVVQAAISVDWLGIFFLALGLGSFQVMLEEGEQYDWFSSPFILTMAALSVIGITFFIWQELTTEKPAVDLRVLKYQSLAAGSVFSIVLGLGLYGALFAIPIFTQEVLQFTATKTGLLLLPGSIASAFMMIIVGQVSRKVDTRILIALGAIILAITMFLLSGINIHTSEDSMYFPLILRGLGTVMMFLPLTLAALAPIAKKDISAATGFMNLTRQIGGSIGIAALTTILAQRENLHRSNLVGAMNPYNPVFQKYLSGTAAGISNKSGAIIAHQQAYGLLDRQLDLQSALMSFGDLFHIVGFAFLFSLLLLFFLGSGKGNPDAAIEAH